MLDIEDFDAVFPHGVTYSDGIVQQILENRNALRGKTFFERLLGLLKITEKRVYPPKSHLLLHDLHQCIVLSETSLHNKHCLIFYLLNDLSPQLHEATELATGFAQDVHLEARFRIFIEGLWHLDHLEFRTAVEKLTHPSIIPTFPDEILYTLLKGRDNLGSVGVQRGTEDDILPLAYFNCVSPPLEDQKVREEFARYFSQRNITETFHWIRSRPEYEHNPLLEILVEGALERSAWSSGVESELYTREERALELVNLPFSDEEHGYVEKFLTEGKGRTFQGAQDTVLMRRIATGRLTDVAGKTGARGKKHGGVDWEILKDGIKGGLGPRKDDTSLTV